MLKYQKEPWMKDGLCRGVDPDLFYPERGVSTKEAKDVCFKCPVREECLECALRNREKFGIWGGMSERERRALRRKLAAQNLIVDDEPEDDIDDEEEMCYSELTFD